MIDSSKKIVLVSYQPLTVKMEQDFYINRALQEGFKVEYWDLTRVYNNGLRLTDSLDREYIKRFSTLEEVATAVQRSEKDSWFILFMTYEFRIVKLLRIFTVYDRQTTFFARGMLPFPLLHQPLIKKLYHKFKLITDFRYIKNYLGNKLALIAKSTKWVKVHDIVFCAGSEGYNTIGIGANMDVQHGKAVNINAIDYDKMMVILDTEQRLLDFKYCVFLDVYLPYHPDFRIMKINQVNPEQYYAALNAFFSSLEKQYNIKVVIAAHPKADYTVNPFEDRLIIRNKTAELVKNCEFAVAHHSTSVSFAVLFEKPLLFIYENEIKRLYRYSYVQLIASFAEVLNAAVYNISEDNKWEIKPVDKNRYTAYKYKYLTSLETEGSFTEDVVMSTLGSIKASHNGY